MMPFWCLVLLGGLLPSSQGLPILGSILGARDGLLGTGILGRGGPSGEESGGPLAGDEASRSGVLGTGILGGQPGSSGLLSPGIPILGGEGLGNGLLSNDILGNKNLLGDKGLLGKGILGGEGLGNGLLDNGLLGNGSLLGDKGLLGTGVLGGDNGLLGDNSLLGDKGLLGTGLLGPRDLLGNGSLLGLDGLLGEGGLLGQSVLHKLTPLGWLKVLNLENVRVSWKVLRGGELVLNLYSKLVLRFPGVFRFLSGSSIETNITSHIALTQDTPGDLRLAVKDCSNLLGGSRINLQSGLLSTVVSRLLTVSLRSLVPAVLCPLVSVWVSVINLNLQFINRAVSFGLLGKIYSALSNVPVTAEHSVELDLQNSPFPSAFIDWLLQTAGIYPSSIP